MIKAIVFVFWASILVGAAQINAREGHGGDAPAFAQSNGANLDVGRQGN